MWRGVEEGQCGGKEKVDGWDCDGGARKKGRNL